MEKKDCLGTHKSSELEVPSFGDVLNNLEGLEDIVDSSREKNEISETIEMVEDLQQHHFLGDTIQKYTTKDIAQAFLGSVVFSIPLLVEGGVFEIAYHFNQFTVGGLPIFLLMNTLFIVFFTLAIVYWSDIRNVHITRPIFGFIPRRLLGLLIISFLTTAAMMTVWGRLDGWKDITIALSRINVVWTVSAFGAALGDILPGESKGKDINEIIKEIG